MLENMIQLIMEKDQDGTLDGITVNDLNKIIDLFLY